MSAALHRRGVNTSVNTRTIRLDNPETHAQVTEAPPHPYSCLSCMPEYHCSTWSSLNLVLLVEGYTHLSSHLVPDVRPTVRTFSLLLLHECMMRQAAMPPSSANCSYRNSFIFCWISALGSTSPPEERHRTERSTGSRNGLHQRSNTLTCLIKNNYGGNKVNDHEYHSID